VGPTRQREGGKGEPAPVAGLPGLEAWWAAGLRVSSRGDSARARS
jgi:hypothetical protein